MQGVPGAQVADGAEGVEGVRVGTAVFWLMLALLCAALVVRLSR